MAGYNRIEIIGHVGRTPEMKTTPSGKSVCSFSVAVSERKDGETQWFSVQAWEKLAEICGKYLVKGSQAMVTGRMQSRKYEDKEGNKREAWEIIAREMVMLGSKGEAQSSEPRTYKIGDPIPPAGEYLQPVSEFDSELPF